MMFDAEDEKWALAAAQEYVDQPLPDGPGPGEELGDLDLMRAFVA